MPGKIPSQLLIKMKMKKLFVACLISILMINNAFAFINCQPKYDNDKRSLPALRGSCGVCHINPNGSGPQNAFSILATGQSLMNIIIKVLIGFAMVMIIIGVVKFIMAGSSGSEEAKDKAKGTILYGVLGLFIIVTMWSLVGIVRRTLGTNTDEKFPLPCVPGYAQGC